MIIVYEGDNKETPLVAVVIMIMMMMMMMMMMKDGYHEGNP